VTRDELAPLFDRPLREAAKSLHISATALKGICRKLKISRWPFQQRAWSEARALREKLEPIQGAVVGGGAHEICEFGALTIADAQPPPVGEVEKRVWSHSAPAVDIQAQDKRVQRKGRSQSDSQSSSTLEMLRWHSVDYDNELEVMADVFDTGMLMQGCNSLTLETDWSRVADCHDDRGMQRVPRQGQSPGTDSGDIWYECGDVAQKMPEYLDMLSAHATVAQAVPSWASALRHSSRQTGLSHAADRFPAATRAEAAMSQHELQALGYTDCDLSYLTIPAASCCRA